MRKVVDGFVESMFVFFQALTDHHGLLEIPPRPGVYIQFAGAANESGSNLHAVDGHSLFTKHLVNTITNRKLNLGEVFRRISDSVYEESKHQQKLLSTDGLNELSEAYLMELISGTSVRKPEQWLKIAENADFLSPQSAKLMSVRKPSFRRTFFGE